METEITTNPGKPDTGVPPVSGMRGSFKDTSEAPEPPPQQNDTTPKDAEPQPEPKKGMFEGIKDLKEQSSTARQEGGQEKVEGEPDKEGNKKVKKIETGAEFIKRIKAENEELRHKHEKLQKLIEEERGLRQKTEELVERLRLEESPRYKREFVEPIQQKKQQAAKIISDIENAEEIIDKASRLQGKERWEYLDENIDSRSAASAVAAYLVDIDEIEARRQAISQNPKQTLKEYQYEANEQADALVNGLFEQVGELVSNNLAAYRKTGDAEHDALVDENLSKVKMLLSGRDIDPEDAVMAAYLAVIAPQYINENKAIRQENEELRQKLAKYERNKPSIGTQQSDGTKPSGVVGIRDVTRKWLKE